MRHHRYLTHTQLILRPLSCYRRCNPALLLDTVLMWHRSLCPFDVYQLVLFFLYPWNSDVDTILAARTYMALWLLILAWLLPEHGTIISRHQQTFYRPPCSIQLIWVFSHSVHDPSPLVELHCDIILYLCEFHNDQLANQLSQLIRRYIIDQGSPCLLATLNPFGRELLLSDVFTGFKRLT
jgi:hypothetical protein